MTEPRTSRSKRTLFYLITLVIPFILLALLEGILRVSGYGNSYPLFVDAKGIPGYLQPNLEVIHRYFARPELAPNVSIDTVYFKKDKPADTFRVVVQGGSSAAGFPYGRWGGLAGMLNDRLENAFPDKQIEVITTAMSAVNSYTLLDFVDEIVAIQPDAVLIYAGHNEYLGVMGAGSSLTASKSHAATLLHLKLRHLRLYQLLQQVISSAQSSLQAPSDGTEGRGTLMAKAASSQKIPYRSDIFNQGLTQFQDNMSLILDKYAAAGVPVFIGTLASNERDQPPFAGQPEQHSERWEALWPLYRAALENGDYPTARTTLSELVSSTDAANAWYALAQLEHRAGHFDNALKAFQVASTRDQLRFRAPLEINQIIRRLASRDNVTLVDVEQALRGEADDGIIGDEVMLEHLHPNARGYFLLADSYYEALKHSALLGQWQEPFSREQAWQEIPLTEIDQLLADYKMQVLKADYPFTEHKREVRFPATNTPLTQLAAARHSGQMGWPENMQRLLGYYRQQQDPQKAAVVARMLAQAFPSQQGPQFATGMLFMQLKSYPRSLAYLNRAVALKPDNLEALKARVFVAIQMGNTPLARQYMVPLEAVAGDDPFVQQLKARL